MKITSPTLLLNETICKANIQMMVDKATANKLILRPHFKTHQSKEVGEWFREVGVDKICVSSIKMAQYFADNNWTDITIAFPVNILEIEKINDLAASIKLNLLSSSPETITYLENNLSDAVDLFIDIDTGYHRTGISYTDTNRIDELLTQIENCSKITFAGFLAHAGHSYKSRSKEEILKVHEQTLEALNGLKKKYISAFPNLIVSNGDTPTCSVANDFGDIDEIRAGNYVFYDYTQYKIGSCEIDQIAVAMACPVVEKKLANKQLIIHGGGVHFSKDSIEEDRLIHFGRIVANKGNTWGKLIDAVFLSSISQEHGTIQCTPTFFEQTNIGDVIYILPIHSCLTADSMKSHTTLGGAVLEHLEGA